jgi:hypothetical protein
MDTGAELLADVFPERVTLQDTSRARVSAPESCSFTRETQSRDVRPDLKLRLTSGNCMMLQVPG